MKLSKRLISAFLAANMLVSTALAQQAPHLTESDLQKTNQATEEAGLRTVNEPHNKRVAAYDKNNNLVAVIPYSDAETLNNHRPSVLESKLEGEQKTLMERAKQLAGSTAQVAGAATTAAWSHSIRNLPTESAMFFMAMGAVMAMQLVTNYAQDPMAMQNHIEHQMSPLGVVGFFTFMYSQGVTANALSMMIRNKTFSKFIPYIGMSVGFAAQSYFSAILTSTHAKACAKSLLRMNPSEQEKQAYTEMSACDTAWKELGPNGLMWELAPSLVSMLLSSAAAGVVEHVAARAVAKVVGVQVATWLFPGGAQVKGLRLLVTKGLQLSMFVSLDMWFAKHITYVWKNIFDGRQFTSISDDLYSAVKNLNSQGWQDPTTVSQALQLFNEKSAAWRAMNLTDVHQAHISWKSMLNQLLGMYDSSKQFYGAFVGEAIQAKDDYYNHLNNVYPLNGVKVKELAKGKESLYFTHTRQLEKEQAAVVDEVAASMVQDHRDGKYNHLPYKNRVYLDAAYKYLAYKNPKNFQEEIYKKGVGIRMLVSEVNDPRAGHISRTNLLSSKDYKKVVREILARLGEPAPMLEQGRAYGHLFEKYQLNNESIKDLAFPPDVEGCATRTLTDYLTLQMLYGSQPEKGDALITQKMGFAAYFQPPKITVDNKHPKILCTDPLRSEQTFSRKVEVSGGFMGLFGKEEYPNVMEYLKANIRPDIAQNFNQWWTDNTESFIAEAFKDYAQKYDQIAVKLLKALFNNERSSLNSGPMENNALLSMRQQLRMNLMVLRELILASYKQQKTQIPEVLLAPQGTPTIIRAPQTGAEYLQALVSFKPMSLEAGFASAQNLIFQDTIEEIFDEVVAALKTLKVGTVQKENTLWNKIAHLYGGDTREVIKGNLGSAVVAASVMKFDVLISSLNQMMNLEADAAAVMMMLGQDSPQKPSEEFVKLTPEQKKLAKKALAGIQETISEASMLVSIINAVNWDKITGADESAKILQKATQSAEEAIKAKQKNLGPASKVGQK